jgi:phosphatidylserine/phosphatidylglycerophosphate/cardiolipin synthase-like enzyme
MPDMPPEKTSAAASSRKENERAICRIGENCRDIVSVERTGLLIDGEDYYRAFYQAARSAERTILVSGWQFDSGVPLLRGKDAGSDCGDVRLLSFLNELCEKNDRLRIYLLAWNFSAIYSLDREWFQEWYFNWTTNERFIFCFDHYHALGASHHQKFVVIDSRIAFVGGLDLCSSRWDNRAHLPENPDRVNADQAPYRPFHDIQSYHVGPPAEELAGMFKDRWRIVCGDDLELPRPPHRPVRLPFKPTEEVRASRVAISRTQAASGYENQGPIREIRSLFLDAIDAAQELIYFENQYFSSKAIYEALVKRMSDWRRRRLEIVMVLTKEADALLEQISIGVAQVRILRHLRALAGEMGHSLGVYYTAASGPDGQEVPVYIHSKLLLVDDRFLTVGSANMNNRSMGLDTELNVAWEAAPDEKDAIQSIRRVRESLLAEHTGIADPAERRKLGRTKGLVEALDRLVEAGSFRLRRHPLQNGIEDYPWLRTLVDNLPFDSEDPVFEETSFEEIPGKKDGLFTKGVTSLKNWLQTIVQKPETREGEAVKSPSHPPRL